METYNKGKKFIKIILVLNVISCVCNGLGVVFMNPQTLLNASTSTKSQALLLCGNFVYNLTNEISLNKVLVPGFLSTFGAGLFTTVCTLAYLVFLLIQQSLGCVLIAFRKCAQMSLVIKGRSLFDYTCKNYSLFSLK